MMLFFSKPSHALTFLDRWIPRLSYGTAVLMVIGLWLALAVSPVDKVQGETVRIMYIHVPASWGALLTYFGMAVVSCYAFVKQMPMAHLMTKAMAPIGTLLCAISLITGAIWGKPTWGTWWVWDARLTSMLLLFFLYGGYLMTVFNMKPETKALKTAAIIALVGSLNLPIIKWSVTWWNTLHQSASLMRIAKPAIHVEMLIPLLVMTAALFSFCLLLFFLSMPVLLIKNKVRAISVG